MAIIASDIYESIMYSFCVLQDLVRFGIRFRLVNGPGDFVVISVRASLVS